MRDRAQELKAQSRAGKNRAEGNKAVLDTLAKLPASDSALGKHLHDIVTTHAPGLIPRLWYGMPAYANEQGKPVCFFQPASKFKTRYSTFAFTDSSAIDSQSDTLWPTGFGIRSISPADEVRLIKLVKAAVRGAHP